MSDDYDPQSVNAMLSRMEERQKGNTEMLTKVCTKVDKHEDDIQALKGWRFYVIGIATGAGFALHQIKDWLSGK